MPPAAATAGVKERTMDTHTELTAGVLLCPLCHLSVLPGDPVVFSHADTIHLNCHLKRDSVTETVADFLRRRAGAEHCHRCLATVLQSTYDDVFKAVTTLYMTRGYRITPVATCAVCGKAWTTIRAEAPGAAALAV
jgi:hypothetical protein